MKLDFLAIGDTVVDDFIRLQDAEVHCDINNEKCTISMRFGDKIPFESSTVVYGVGNSANAAVAAARLGLKSALIADVGDDANGREIIKQFKKEKVETRYVRKHKGIPTNYHYVLWFQAERTILVKHHEYLRVFPKNPPKAKTVYLSSLGPNTESYHNAVITYLEKHPDIQLAFQPGTFQMKLGIEKLARIYKRTNLFFANKEEYQRILALPETDEKKLLESLHALGPKTCFLTDGVHGAYVREENGNVSHYPIFPDPKPPLQRTGAGDAFSSTTTAYLTMGYSLPDSIKRGLVNAAYVVQGIGAQRGLLTKKEIEELAKTA